MDLLKKLPNKCGFFGQLINNQSQCHEVKPRISTFALRCPANVAVFLRGQSSPILAPKEEIVDP